jgi:hypothetical protein
VTILLCSRKRARETHPLPMKNSHTRGRADRASSALTRRPPESRSMVLHSTAGTQAPKGAQRQAAHSREPTDLSCAGRT